MDECLPIGSLDASTLQKLLTQERTRRQELEREVPQLRAGLARQNEVIIRLEQRDAERCRELAEHRTLIAGLTEPGTRVRVCLLRQQVALLQQAQAQLQYHPDGLCPPRSAHQCGDRRDPGGELWRDDRGGLLCRLPPLPRSQATVLGLPGARSGTPAA